MRPLIDAGDISAIYMGQASAAAPTATPLNNLKKENHPKDPAQPVPIPVMANNIAQRIKDFFLPMASLILLLNNAPIAQPKLIQPTAQPISISFSLKYLLKKGIAPDMVTRSNPNKIPPIAVMALTRNIYLRLKSALTVSVRTAR